MIKAISLTLLAFYQFVSCQQSTCPENGPEKLKLRAQYNDYVNGYVYIAYCENVDENGCPQRLTHPYENASQFEKCRFISKSPDGEYTRENYQCDYKPQIDKFIDKSLENKWICHMLSS